jgi:hypothetical protein
VSVEEMLRQVLERLERLEERAGELWKRYKRLKLRSQRALERLREAVAELEAVDSRDPHVQAGLELLYDVERLLEIEGSEK